MDTRQVTQTPSDRWGPLPRHASRRPRHRALRWLERVLLAIAIVSLGYYAYAAIESHLYQSYEDRQLDAILKSAPARPLPSSAPANVATPRHHDPPPGSVVGRIDIPRLHVSAVVRAGSDARTLRLAVGYIPGTALPGEPGNIGLAGHRDTFFRRLRDIRPRDEIRIETPRGTYRYRVANTRIVNPDDVWVLDPTPHPTLTLVTCYPFTYIGSAPRRFIVRAQLEPVSAPSATF
jgi:sortase A